jgi:hypothetical protein
VNLSAYFSREELGAEDRLRTEVHARVSGDEKLRRLFTGGIEMVDSATPPPPGRSPRYLITTMNTTDTQMAGTDLGVAVILHVFQFEQPRGEYAKPYEPGIATLIRYLKRLLLAPGNFKLNVRIGGQDLPLVRLSEPQGASLQYENQGTVLTVKLPWRYEFFIDPDSQNITNLH